MTDLQIAHLVFIRSLWLRAYKNAQGPTLPFRKFNKGIVTSYYHMKNMFHAKWMKPKLGSCMSQLQASINIEIKVKANTNIPMPTFFYIAFSMYALQKWDKILRRSFSLTSRLIVTFFPTTHVSVKALLFSLLN